MIQTAAIIGCGKGQREQGAMTGFSVGRNHARSWKKAIEGIDLIAVDIVEENLKAFAEEFEIPAERCFLSTEAMYEALTPDVVSIGTWPALHCPQTIEAARAGVKAIVCEKPMALDVLQINEMIAACKRNNVNLNIAHQRRYEGIFVKMAEVVQSGRIGDRWVGQFRVGDGWDILSWTTHWFDMAAYLFDSKATHVLAGVNHQGSRRYNHAVEDASVVFTEFEGGHQGLFVTGPDEVLPMISISGRDGEIRLDKGGLAVYSRDGFEHVEAPGDHIGGYVGLFRDVNRVVAGEIEHTRCDASLSADGTRIAYAVHESARTQKTIELAKFQAQYAPLEVLQHPAQNKRDYGRVVVIADNHHEEKSTGLSGRDGLVAGLKTAGVTDLTVIKAEDEPLRPAHLAEADMLVIYHTRRTADAETEQALTAWLDSGKPLVVSHCGIGAYDLPAYREAIGRCWVWQRDDPLFEEHGASGHPHEPCDIVVQDSSKFMPGWDQAWLPTDEVYVQLCQTAEVNELAEAVMPDGTRVPLAWQSVANPQVVVWGPGHRPDIWDLPAMSDGLRAAMDLALCSSKA